eukprot:1159641-Pelagomonas_calceolata.AAC.12
MACEEMVREQMAREDMACEEMVCEQMAREEMGTKGGGSAGSGPARKTRCGSFLSLNAPPNAFSCCAALYRSSSFCMRSIHGVLRHCMLYTFTGHCVNGCREFRLTAPCQCMQWVQTYGTVLMHVPCRGTVSVHAVGTHPWGTVPMHTVRRMNLSHQCQAYSPARILAAAMHQCHMPTAAAMHQCHMPTAAAMHQCHMPTAVVMHQCHMPTAVVMHQCHMPTPKQGFWLQPHVHLEFLAIQVSFWGTVKNLLLFKQRNLGTFHCLHLLHASPESLPSHVGC